MEIIKINEDYITLQQLLKLTNIISSGGESKYYLQENKVFVNDELETRRGRKLYKDYIIKIKNKVFKIDK